MNLKEMMKYQEEAEKIRSIAYKYGEDVALKELKKTGAIKGNRRFRTPKEYQAFDLAWSVSAFEGYTFTYYNYLSEKKATI